jgi:uncharacterized membrane-anchored protein
MPSKTTDMKNTNSVIKEEEQGQEIMKATVHSTFTDEERGATAADATAEQEEAHDAAPILKIPRLTPIYWCEKMTATTFGETFADFWTQTLKFGYTYTSIILLSVYFVSLGCQIKVKTYWPVLFWLVMSTSSIAGTCVSDFIDRTLEWGYPTGMGVLLGILLFIMGCWKLSGEHMNVAGSMTRKAEAFYWSTILVSNTLGTALGDFMSDSLNFGFAVSAGIMGSLLLICAALAYWSKVSHVLLFWIAFVLTRPFGATFGDLLTKSKEKGGLDLGTLQASMVIFALFIVAFAFEMYYLQKEKKAKALEAPTDSTVEDSAVKNENKGIDNDSDEVLEEEAAWSH